MMVVTVIKHSRVCHTVPLRRGCLWSWGVSRSAGLASRGGEQVMRRGVCSALRVSENLVTVVHDGPESQDD